MGYPSTFAGISALDVATLAECSSAEIRTPLVRGIPHPLPTDPKPNFPRSSSFHGALKHPRDGALGLSQASKTRKRVGICKLSGPRPAPPRQLLNSESR